MDISLLDAFFRRLSLLHAGADEAALVEDLSAARSPVILAFANAHAVNIARQSPGFFDSLCAADYLLRDGIGVSILLRLFGVKAGLNANGTDLIPKLLARFAGRRVALCGTAEPQLSAAVDHVRRSGCDIAVALDGFGPREGYLSAIQAARPELVVLGMGMPKQERIAQYLAQHLDYPVVIVCGGAILDRWAGRVVRPPAFIRRMRMEWLFRLALEPKRLWRRYTVGVVSFLFWAVALRLSARGSAMASQIHTQMTPQE